MTKKMTINHIGTNNIETHRLILRRANVFDVKTAYNNWMSDEEVAEYLTWDAHKSIDETESVILLWMSKYSNKKFYHWIIEKKT